MRSHVVLHNPDDEDDQYEVRGYVETLLTEPEPEDRDDRVASIFEHLEAVG